MKIAISGKGGVGKTTLTAVFAKLLAVQGKRVIALDADPAASLASALGMADDAPATPLADLRELIAERTGTSGPGAGAIFKMNPDVADLPDKYSVEKDGIRLLVLGGVRKGGAGCACPESAFMRTLLAHLVLHRDEVVLADMAAGIEHLGRATAQGVDALVVVVEPGRRSIDTGRRIIRLAADIGLDRAFVVGNKVRTPAHRAFVRDAFPDARVVGCVSYHERAAEADLEGRAAYEDEALLAEGRVVLDALVGRLPGGASPWTARDGLP